MLDSDTKIRERLAKSNEKEMVPAREVAQGIGSSPLLYHCFLRVFGADGDCVVPARRPHTLDSDFAVHL